MSSPGGILTVKSSKGFYSDRVGFITTTKSPSSSRSSLSYPANTRRMLPLSSLTLVNQYLLSAMLLASFITCTHNLPLMEMETPTEVAATPQPISVSGSSRGHSSSSSSPFSHYSHQGRRQHRHRHNRRSKSNSGRQCPFGKGGMVGDQIHCCKHGGVPVMNRCACPRNYGGEYCELKKRSCLHVPHGGVFTKGCALCTCEFGVVSCITRVFKECNALPSYQNDDGRMLTYNMRSPQQRQKAIKKYPILVEAKSRASNSLHLTDNNISLRTAIPLVVTFILSQTFLGG